MLLHISFLGWTHVAVKPDKILLTLPIQTSRQPTPTMKIANSESILSTRVFASNLIE